MNFEVIGDVTEVETFAVKTSIRELPRLRRIYGAGRWRKRKGVAQVRLEDSRSSAPRSTGTRLTASAVSR
jgi:hypothetical protein